MAERTRARWTYAEFARLPSEGSTRYEIIDDVLFVEGDYMEPDLVFVRRDRLGLLSDRGVEGAPDLLVEVPSPSTANRDRGIKLERYRHFGVTEYWIVEPDARTVELWKLAEGASEPIMLNADDHLRWEPMAGGPVLELQLEELFRPA